MLDHFIMKLKMDNLHQKQYLLMQIHKSQKRRFMLNKMYSNLLNLKFSSFRLMAEKCENLTDVIVINSSN